MVKQTETVISDTPVQTGPKFIRVKSVTRPVFKFPTTASLYLRFDGPIYIAEKSTAPSQKDMEPPHLANVTDMETGEEGQIVLGSVLISELEKAYPGETYVGKIFEIGKKKIPEKKYSLWTINEVSVG